MNTTVNVMLRRYLEPIKRKIQTLLTKGTIRRVDQPGGLTKFQVESFKDDIKEDIENYSQFGFKSHPPKGSECILSCVGGNNEHIVAVATEHQATLKSLPELKEGEAIMYDNTGKYIHIKGGNIEAMASKIKIQNDSEELISLLSEAIQQIRISKWNSVAGPLPIFEADGVKLDMIKQRLDTFKV